MFCRKPQFWSPKTTRTLKVRKNKQLPCVPIVPWPAWAMWRVCWKQRPREVEFNLAKRIQQIAPKNQQKVIEDCVTMCNFKTKCVTICHFQYVNISFLMSHMFHATLRLLMLPSAGRWWAGTGRGGASQTVVARLAQSTFSDGHSTEGGRGRNKWDDAVRGFRCETSYSSYSSYSSYPFKKGNKKRKWDFSGC